MARVCRNKWIRSYRAFAILAIIIFLIQIYLAYKFFAIDIENESNLPEKSNPQKNYIFLEDGENGGMSARKSKDGFVTDDEDNPGEQGSVKKKQNEVTKLVQNYKNKSSLRLDELDFVPMCDIHTKEAISAIHRAKTQKCKQKIVNITCAIQNGKLYEEYLPNYCPNHEGTSRKALGCFKDEKTFRLLPGYYANYKDTNSPDLCVNMCLQGGFPYAGVQYSTECFCGENSPPSSSKLADSSCNMKCPGNPRHLCGGFFTMNVFQTGITKFQAQPAAAPATPGHEPVRIVFLLTLNGRAMRQVRRLINVLYDPKHYFFIHIDERQDYLYRTLLYLENSFSNIKLARKRFATIWGGASLLEMLLASMEDLLALDWNWDFVINLSESDFPVKSVEKLEQFLYANKGRNFVKSHGREVQRFIQKQGLDKTFVECDAHMWRVGDRKLPWGLQVDGGSDWVALDRSFVSYVAGKNKDPLLTGLLTVFKHTLLPAESFFHTVLRNSKFCNTYIDNNLHVTNWKRKLGCKCQYKHVVDWCGCSPNDFRVEDWPRLQATEQRQLFFARKFEPIINQAIILRVEQWIGMGDQEQLTNLDAYWQSIYHSEDTSPVPDDSLLTIAASITRHNAKILHEEGCSLVPGHITEISSYHYVDVFKGILVFHEVEVTDYGTVMLETWFKHQHHLRINSSAKLHKRLKMLAVSSDFDQKEQVFRNLVRALGPFSEPAIMYHFVPGPDEPLTTNNITIMWMDSIGNVADVSDVFIDEGNVINYIKPNLKVPLIPGIWTIKMIENKVLVAQTKFLVTPLEFMSTSKISQQEASMLHSGSSQEYVDFSSHLNVIKPFLSKDSDKAVARLKADANAKRFGLDLAEWIDGLVLQFYSVLGTCVVSKSDDNLQCGKISIEPCHNTDWSSFAPDPKSFQKKVLEKQFV